MNGITFYQILFHFFISSIFWRQSSLKNTIHDRIGLNKIHISEHDWTQEKIRNDSDFTGWNFQTLHVRKLVRSVSSVTLSSESKFTNVLTHEFQIKCSFFLKLEVMYQSVNIIILIRKSNKIKPGWKNAYRSKIMNQSFMCSGSASHASMMSRVTSEYHEERQMRVKKLPYNPRTPP